MEPSARVEGGMCLSPEDDVVIPEECIGEEGTEGILGRPSNGGSQSFVAEGLGKRIPGGCHGPDKLIEI